MWNLIGAGDTSAEFNACLANCDPLSLNVKNAAELFQNNVWSAHATSWACYTQNNELKFVETGLRVTDEIVVHHYNSPLPTLLHDELSLSHAILAVSPDWIGTAAFTTQFVGLAGNLYLGAEVGGTPHHVTTAFFLGPHLALTMTTHPTPRTV
jgi:hypothetical protein